jgi:CRP/FNR family transcriptional regulator
MNIESHLRSSHFGAGLDSGELHTLAGIAVARNIGKGEILFLEGDPAIGFYVLLKGRLRIFKSSAEGKEYTIHQIQPGQMFAEAAVFKGGIFPANCSAQEDSVIALFPKDSFLELIKNSPQISLKIISSLSGFLRDYNQQVENLSLKEVSGRIAAYILNEAERQNRNMVSLDSSKTELARRLGTISETLSRNLRRLKEAGIIEVDRNRITILDFNKLSAIAEGEKI